MKNNKIKTNLQLLLADAMWGSSFYIMKDMFVGISPVLLIGVRYFTAGAILGVILLLKGHHLLKDLSKSLLLGVVMFFIAVPQSIGLEVTSSANSAFITGLFVLSAPVFSYILLKRKPQFQALFTVGLALVGLWILTGGVSNVNFGDTITLITALSIGLHIVLTEKLITNGNDPMVSLFQQFIIMSLLSFAVSFAIERPLLFEAQSILLPMLYLAIFPTLLSYGLQFLAQKKTSSTNVAIVISTEPVFAAVFAWTLGGESFIVSSAVGGAVIVLSMIVSELPIKKLLYRS